MSKTMSLPSCSTGVNGTRLGGCLIEGSGASFAELALGNRSIPTARAEPMMTRARTIDTQFLILEVLRILGSKNVGSRAPGEGGPAKSVASGARLGARAGRARPARDGRVHRRGDPAMRTTGRRWAASGDHGGSIRASFGTETEVESTARHGARARRTGPLPTGLFAERGRDGGRPGAGRPIERTAGAPELSRGQARGRCVEDRRGPAGIRPGEVVTPPGASHRPDAGRPGRSRRSLSSPATLPERGRTSPDAL